MVALILPVAASAESATSAAGSAAYPRTLTTSEITEHFKTHNRLNAISDSQPFTLTIKGRSAERYCPKCWVSTDSGYLDYKKGKSQVCFTWNKVKFPQDGCYNLIQTGDTTFELRSFSGRATIAYNTTGELPVTKPSSNVSPILPGMKEPAQGTPLSRTVTFRAPTSEAYTQRLMTAGQKALRMRAWNVESCNKNCLRGKLEKSGIPHWVEIRIQAPFVEIGFISGTEEGKPGWLENLKKDMLTALSRT